MEGESYYYCNKSEMDALIKGNISAITFIVNPFAILNSSAVTNTNTTVIIIGSQKSD